MSSLTFQNIANSVAQWLPKAQNFELKKFFLVFNIIWNYTIVIPT
jgi:hypothetical protein